ncbi:MAG: LytTR family transcriptional regulator DNA-binding domain-containing protein [Lachnospiraceae bacterium]|nr:LytTR family transcriptional regulator DNA-binding domain-containing protein [Lachnospiraceae bacterium]
MKVCIKKIARKEDERVIIECVEITPQIKDIRSYITAKGVELSGRVDSQHMQRFCLEDVHYFEAVDEKVFAYTDEQIYEIKMRLYETEAAYGGYHFVRCSKSVVLNLMKLESISPALNGRFFAHMKNGEKLMISRQYAGALKKIVMGESENEK